MKKILLIIAISIFSLTQTAYSQSVVAQYKLELASKIREIDFGKSKGVLIKTRIIARLNGKIIKKLPKSLNKFKVTIRGLVSEKGISDSFSKAIKFYSLKVKKSDNLSSSAFKRLLKATYRGPAVGGNEGVQSVLNLQASLQLGKDANGNKQQVESNVVAGNVTCGDGLDTDEFLNSLKKNTKS